MRSPSEVTPDNRWQQPLSILKCTVARLQTARYLLKALAAAAKGQKLGGGAAYLADAKAEAGRRCEVGSAQGWLDPQAQLAALR